MSVDVTVVREGAKFGGGQFSFDDLACGDLEVDVEGVDGKGMVHVGAGQNEEDRFAGVDGDVSRVVIEGARRYL